LLIEKPPGVSALEAKTLAAASIAVETFTFVAFNRRFIRSMVRLKDWSAQQAVLFARGEMLRTMGNPDSIEVKSRQHHNSSARDYWIRLTFANEAAAEISLMLNTGLRRESYLLTASGAAAETTLGFPYSSDHSFQGDRYWSEEKVVEQHSLDGDPLENGGIVGEYEEFLRLLESGAPSTCSLAEAAISMQLAEAVQNEYSGPFPPLFDGEGP
jgi:predicted dehydrogenase